VPANCRTAYIAIGTPRRNAAGQALDAPIFMPMDVMVDFRKAPASGCCRQMKGERPSRRDAASKPVDLQGQPMEVREPPKVVRAASAFEEGAGAAAGGAGAVAGAADGVADGGDGAATWVHGACHFE
jgi:hypothetical protein